MAEPCPGCRYWGRPLVLRQANTADSGIGVGKTSRRPLGTQQEGARDDQRGCRVARQPNPRLVTRLAGGQQLARLDRQAPQLQLAPNSRIACLKSS